MAVSIASADRCGVTNPKRKHACCAAISPLPYSDTEVFLLASWIYRVGGSRGRQIRIGSHRIRGRLKRSRGPSEQNIPATLGQVECRNWIRPDLVVVQHLHGV